MSSQEFSINGTDYHLVLTDQVIKHVDDLRRLYAAAYDDSESFESINSEISETIREITSDVEPPVDGGDLDDVIQEIIRVVDNKAEAREKELNDKKQSSNSRTGRKRTGPS